MATLERPDPPYLQIARQIKAQIDSGELAPGDPIPSARRITAIWGVANATAGKVLRTLRAEGLITADPGKGSVVARRHISLQSYARSAMRRGRIYPDGHYAVISAAELVPAPDRVVDALGMEPGSQAIRRQRVTYAPDRHPISASVSWFDGALAEQAPLLLSTERILRGTTQYIADVTGRERAAHEKALVRASRASEAEARDLGVEIGSPVLRGRNWYWDVHGSVLEYGESSAGEELEESFEYGVEGDPTQ
jgi:DNA-binding GntR family transcriptional regulator